MNEENESAMDRLEEYLERTFGNGALTDEDTAWLGKRMGIYEEGHPDADYVVNREDEEWEQVVRDAYSE